MFSYTDILSPTDEFEFWADQARQGRGEAKERAENFVDLFKPISKDYGGLDAMSLQDAMEIVDITQDTLDDVWRQTEFDPYPENRMAHLMDCIGKWSCKLVITCVGIVMKRANVLILNVSFTVSKMKSGQEITQNLH